MAERPPLEQLADRIVSGHPIDWDGALAHADPSDRPLVEQLRVLAAIERASASALGAVPPAGSHWGPFELLEVLDCGSYGVVMRARDTRIGRDVAVKLLPTTGGASDERFLAEARALAQMRHPNVVTIYGADRFDGVAGLWMELIEGRSLERIVDEWGPLGPREAIVIGIDLCAALSAVHAAGFVHGDVKSRNVMRQSGGRIVLTDFGGAQAARLDADQTQPVGTPIYMAPELFEGAQPSPQTDLYALAVVLFRLVTGSYPVTGEDAAAIRHAHHRGARRLIRDVRPDVPPALAGVLDRALAANPPERYGSAGDLQRALLHALDVGLLAREPSARPRAWRPVPAWLLGLAVVAALLGGDGLRRWLAAPPAPAGTPTLADAEWTLVRGYRDFADTLVERGEWDEASRAYRQASALFATVHGQFSAAAAIDLAKAAFAASQGAEPARAGADYDFALFYLAGAGGESHLTRAAIEAACAVSMQRRGQYDEAAAALARAIRIRETLFQSQRDVATVKRTPVEHETPWLARLVAALHNHRLDADRDGDWIPDAIEAAVGLDPAAADTDADGRPDAEEDTDGDGVADGLEWGLVTSPILVAGSFGSADPVTVGARREIAGEGGPLILPDLGRPAWRIRATHTAFYSIPLSDTQVRWAMTRGWRLLLRARPVLGQSFAVADMAPLGPQYAINLFAEPGQPPLVRLFTQTMPRASLDQRLASDASLPVLGLHYDPDRQSATLSIDGRAQVHGYSGLTRLQIGRGLLWGATNNLGAAPAGEGLFEFVALEIKP